MGSALELGHLVDGGGVVTSRPPGSGHRLPPMPSRRGTRGARTGRCPGGPAPPAARPGPGVAIAPAGRMLARMSVTALRMVVGSMPCSAL